MIYSVLVLQLVDDVHLRETAARCSMPVPDLAAVSLERWNHAEDHDGWFEWAPELAVEVASLRTERAWARR